MASVLQTIREGGTQHPEEMLHFFQNRAVLTSGTWDLASNHFLVEESDTPAMSVDVRQGYALIRKDADITYPVWLNTEDSTVSITANASGNQRIDAIVLYIDLGASPNSAVSNVAKLVAVAGTPAGSPTAPDSTAIETAIGASNPYIVLAHVTVDSGETTILDADISDQRTDATFTTKFGSTGAGADGWIEYSDVVPTRSVSDDPTYEITFAGVDLTGTLQAGMRVKWTQNSTVRYGIITKVALDGSDTDVTLYGGTDYDVDDTATYAISAFNYSTQKSPFGFPLDPLKWTEEVTNATQYAIQTSSSWANNSSMNLVLPIGSWLFEYQASMHVDGNGTNTCHGHLTYSTANNSESESLLTSYTMHADGLTAGDRQFENMVQRSKHIIVTTKTTLYCNSKTDGGYTVGGMWLRGDRAKSVARAICAYL